MKSIVLASALFFGAALSAQSQDVALNTAHNEVASYTSSAQDILLGEFDVKSKKSKALAKDAYYFENNMGEGIFLKMFLFKVDKARHHTKVNIRLYEKKEFVQDVYVEYDTISYPSYIPGNEIATKEITVDIKPGQDGVVEVDLSKYDIAMPAEGLFVSLELTGYFDEEGNAITTFKSKDLTKIDIHPTTTDNYCGLASIWGADKTFWINNNKSIKADFKYAFKKEPSKSILTAPNFGLKVGHK